MVDTPSTVDIADDVDDAEAERKAKEAYFTAGQYALIWARFKKNRSAMVAGVILMIMILIGLTAPFLSPYDPNIAGRDETYQNGAPQIPKFWDENGFSFRPFLYTLERKRSAATNFRWVTEINRDERRYLQLFVKGWEFNLINIDLNLPGDTFDFRWKALRLETHLFGMDVGKIHLFGTEAAGKDIFSRTLHAIYTSLAVGTIGVMIAFVLSLMIGGVSGYVGGWLDGVIQMITDAVRTVPAIPLFMAVAAFMPPEMTAEAIRRLSSDPDGFYLMVEGGRIDHAHHEGRAGYALEETVELARAVQYALENTDPDETMILVTADHSHVFTMAGYPRRGNPILGLVYPPAGGDDEHPGGTEGPMLARDGQPYTTLGYGNGPGAVQGERGMPETGPNATQQSLIPLGSETHGGEDVALFGTGPGAFRVHGVIEQNLIYDIMRAAYGWEE